MRPYNRSLHIDDYLFLAHAPALRAFEAAMTRDEIPHREWHEHRLWEYASIMQQLEELHVPKTAKLIDVGSGGSFFPPYLVQQGFTSVTLTDSMKYGDISQMVQRQRDYEHCQLGSTVVNLQLFDLLVEDMAARPEIGWDDPTEKFDVTMCISTIEHVDAHDIGMQELVRITKPGGYIFITSDYFRDASHFEQSISRHLQVTGYCQDFVETLPQRFGLSFVGPTDFTYRGDFVHNYSFCNICLRKPE